MVSPELKTLTFTEQVAQICEVRRKHEEELLKKKNVVGLGVGDREKDGQYIKGKVVLSVFVSKKVEPEQLGPDDLIPPVLDGIVETDVVEVSDLRAFKK